MCAILFRGGIDVKRQFIYLCLGRCKLSISFSSAPSREKNHIEYMKYKYPARLDSEWSGI